MTTENKIQVKTEISQVTQGMYDYPYINYAMSHFILTFKIYI